MNWPKGLLLATVCLLVILLTPGVLTQGIPQFSSASYDITFNQNLLVGDIIVNISCSFDGVVNYRFTSPMNVNFLHINQTTGFVSLVNDALDIATGSSSSFVECFDANDNSNFNTAQFRATRVNENEFQPRFLHSALRLSYSEDTAVNTIVALVNATDEDRGELGVIEYSIMSNEPQVLTLFSINSANGVITLQSPLDFETSTRFEFLVRAQNTFDTNIGRNLPITLTVEDTDDTAPAFEESEYNVDVHETVLNNIIAGMDYPRPLPGFLVTRCNDPDSPQIQITYSLLSMGDISPLVLDEATGSFSVTADLDYEIRTSYTFIVTCYDNSERNQSSTVSVDVAVLPVNEQVPQIQRRLSNVFFVETTQVGDIIATANASLTDILNRFFFTDSDAGSDGNITYTLRDGDDGSGDSNFFLLDLISGDLTIAEPLDNDEEGVELISGLYRIFFVSIVGCDEFPPSDQCNSFDFRLFVRSVNEFDPVIAAERYTLSFSESYQTGSVILSASQVSCTDQDQGTGELGRNPVQIITTSSAITELFHIDTANGEIRLQGVFDYDVADGQSYGFEIRCFDNGGREDRAVVSIDIQPENDNRPVFSQRNYFFNVSRTTPANRFVIGTVSATDNDIDLGGDIDYMVQPNGFVDINELGQLLLFNSVLNITQTTISFTTNVTDSEFTDDVLVVLQITEGNTNRPTFAEGTSTAIQLSELAMVGETIADLTCSDPDSGDNGALHFSIASGNTDNTFSIDEITGEIRVDRALIIPDNVTTESYTLSLLCEDRGIPVFSDDATLFINVFRDDSNPPVIANTTINLFVPEDTVRNTLITTIVAVDIDSEQLNYRLENESSPGFFFIEPSSGNLILGAALDRESISVYHMTVIVTEIRIVIGPERSDRANVNIFIRDVNDNSPTCAPSVYNAEVDETAAVGHSIVQLQCDDPDLNENGELTYTLEDDFNVLSIDSSSGEITVGQLLNNTERTILPAVVTVSDSGVPENQSIEVQVVIEIISQNNNRPTFQNLPASIEISEAQSLGDNFFIVFATDPDRGSFGQITYAITEGSEDTFSIISNTGGISLTEKLNFFSQSSYLLNISARDSDFEVFETLMINVLDANEFAPVCELTQESFSLPESIEPSGLVFPQISCSDEDEGSNGQINYTIESGNVGSIFDIQSDGTVVTNGVLDFETLQQYNLQVNVSDGGMPALFTTVMIRVSVTPVNEFAPIFSQNLYQMDIVEDTDITTQVLQVAASDQDSSFHRDGQISYSISGDDASFFTITSSGIIRIASTIDRELTGDSLIFTATATDQAIIPRSTSTLINITVVDLDDNPPVFTNDLYVFVVNASARAGTQIGSILCTDSDAPSNAQVSYSLMGSEEHSSTFVIRDNGVIGLLQDVQINRVFTFDVTCTGPSPRNQSDSATISVRVLLNSTISFHPNSTYVVGVEENSASGTELLIINASSSTGATLGFNQLNLLSQFQVDSTTGRIQLIGALDFETTESYSLRVEATDNGNPPNTNEALVQVNVINLNDRTPRITTVPTEIVREEESINDTQVLDQYLCSDGDRGDFGAISFEIRSGDTNNVFSITPSGMLLLVGDLDYEAVTGYTLQIVCEDGGIPPLSAVITVPVRVLPLNDNPPIFNPVQSIILAENIPVGQDVGVPITATDADTFPHNLIRYSIQPTDSPFSISSTSGQLTLQTSLDFESETEYELSVRADDSGDLSPTNQFEVLSNTVSITITITDVNDNIPIFNRRLYSGQIAESAAIGDQVSFSEPIQCTDTDSGLNGEVSLSLQAAVPFEVLSDGAIAVTAQLDHEGTRFYLIPITCSDPDNTVRASVLIFVADVDEHGPVFVSRTFNFSVSEGDSLGTVVGTVMATDQDGSAAGLLMYEFQNTSLPFTIDQSSGLISLSSIIDYEVEQVYSFFVEAFDAAGNRDTAIVIVQVGNENDNDPVFSETLYILSVRESSPVDTNVGSVVCEDLDDQTEGIPIRYSLGDQSIPFRIDALTGQILVDGEVDFETNARYMIQAFCNDSGSVQASTDVTIDLLPFNDFTPRFVIPSSDNSSELTVDENLVVGSTLQPIIAFDLDQGPEDHHQIVYSIIGGNTGSVFVIDGNFLRLRLPLDREVVAEYELILRAGNVISADDMSNSSSLFSIALYTIIVNDINDNTPVLTPENPPLITLIESNSSDINVAIFECSDPDEGLNGMIIFSLSSASPLDNFNITQNGVVRTTGRVSSSLVLNVICSDQGSPPRSTSVSLAINSIVANEHTPIFSSPTYRFSVLENATLGTIIDCVSASDLDGADTPDGTIMYSLRLESPQSNQSSFSIQSDTGCVIVAAPLNFDDVRSYFYQVVATDLSIEPLSSTAQLFISVEDAIPAVPVFVNTPYSTTLFENQESGTFVYQLVCTDIDDNDVIQYSINDGNSQGIFTVNNTTGVITLSAEMTLDYEMSTVHILTVTCTDIHNLQATTLVTVMVSPVNEFTPTFFFGPFEIEENAILRTEVIQLQSFDGDDGPDGEVMFEVIGDIMDDDFTVTSVGQILVNGELDREDLDFYSFEVLITDQSMDPLNRRMTSHLVNVTILDQNDNEPTFSSETYTFGSLSGNETIGFIVGNVSCTDSDQGVNSVISYSLQSGSSLFNVNMNTGDIFVAGNLETRQLDDIILFIDCSDSGSPRLSDTARVLVEIQEVNRHVPIFLNSSYSVAVPEDTALLNEVIVKVEAVDMDNGVNGEVRYSLLDSIDATFFIDEDTGDITILTSLDAESRTEYILTVIARDGALDGHTQMSTQVNVTIEVTGVNEFAPVCIDPIYVAIINATTIGPIINLQCTDSDVGADGDLSYAILSGDVNRQFSVNQNGILNIPTAIPPDPAIERFILQIVVRDLGSPSLNTTVEAILIYSFDNLVTPAFNSPTYNYTVSELAMVGLVFGTVQALDSDPGLQGQLSYSISGTENFDIDPQSGELFVSRPLDWESVPSHTFSVLAVDMDPISPLRGEANVTVSVLNENDNVPRCENTFYAVEILSNVTINETVIELNCEDPDQMMVRFDIQNGLVSPFSIDPFSGRVFVTRPVAPSTTTVLDINVIGFGGEFSEVTISIQSIFINVHPPAFTTIQFSLTVLESTPLLTVVGSIIATDSDSPQADLTYLIEDQSPPAEFYINPSTGDVVLTLPLDFESTTQYTYNVSVLDSGSFDGTNQLMTTGTLTINVTNANDNVPMLSSNGIYGATVSETAAIGARIINMTCTDNDMPPFGSTQITANLSTSPFSLVSVEGQYTIEVAQSLSSPQAFIFNVYCIDNGGLRSQGQAYIFVPEPLAPVFTEQRYDWTLSEASEPGEEYTNIQATSNDGSVVSYSITDGNDDSIFYIDPSSGVVSLVRTLDFETQTTHGLVVRAADGSRRQSSVLLLVNVRDENDEVPLTPPSALLSVRQNAPVGFPIGVLTCTDRDTIVNATFRFDPPSNLFVVDEFGVVRLDGELSDTPVYSLPVICFDVARPQDISTGIVTIEVEFVNLFQPEFNFNEYIFQIAEDTSPLSIVGQVSANDSDVGSFGDISYFIVDGNPEQFFIDATTGHIGVLTSLDRESINTYTLTVLAIDGGVAASPESRLNASTQVEIRVTDANDNAPLPEQFTYIQSISTNHTLLTPVLSVACTDADLLDNAAIDYSLEQDGQDFIIQSNGTILLAREQNTRTVHNFRVVCTDRGANPLSSTAQVTVTVDIVSLRAPLFDQDGYNVTIGEDIAIHTVILEVNAVPSNPGIEVVYSIVAGNDEALFTVDPLSGAVLVVGQLDATLQQQYVLTISAAVTSRSTISSLTTVRVMVTDLNDNVPIFSSPFYAANVTERSSISTPVIQLVCTDSDLNADISYFIFYTPDIFNITEEGLIYVAGDIDFERNVSHTFEVVCTDGGDSPRTARTLVRVNVDPVNEFVPTFTQSLYNFNASENGFGTQIGILEAIDGDAGIHGNVRYMLQDPSNNSVIFVNAVTGELIVSANLDYEMQRVWDLSILAVDGGGLESHTIVHIDVQNLNDVLPVISPMATIATINSDSPAGQPIQSYSCTDGDGSQTTLSIDSGNSLGLFELSSSDVLVWTGLGSTLDANAVISLNLLCTDNELLSQRVSGHIAIRIQVTDALSPVFSESIYQRNISENATIGTIILTVSATSESMNTSYSFFNLPSGFPFEINSVSGQVTLTSSLNRETESLYTFFVGAIDVITSGVGVVLVEVRVEDSNDNTPMVFPSQQTISLPEDFITSTEFIHFMCSDRDTGVNGELSFMISSGNDNNTFVLTRVSSQIVAVSLRAPLDFELVTEYSLSLECADGGSPPLSDYATLNVVVTSVNEFSPVFSLTEYFFEVNETALPGSLVGTVSATDADSGEDGAFMYQIGQSAHSAYFTVNSEGEIYTTSLDLNATEIEQLQFLLRAVDTGGNEDIAMVTVRVMDINTPPILSDFGTYFTTLTTNQTISDVILELFCYDIDTAQNAAIELEFSNQPDAVNIVTNRQQGVVSATFTLISFLSAGTYDMTVTCSDNGTQPLSVSSIVTIQVQGTNTAPVFDHDSLFVSILEDAVPGALLTRVNATDAEGNVSYAIIGGTGRGAFTIDSVTGEINLLLDLNHELISSYVLMVSAFDNSILNPLSAQISVNIDVININDEFPIITPQGTIQIVITEDQEVGVPIQGYTCTDPDGTNRVSLSLSPHSSPFTLNQHNEVILQSTVDSEQQDSYTLEITCTDSEVRLGSGITLTTSVSLVVTVTPVNSHAPVFLGPFELSVAEDTSPGSVIGQLRAIDMDMRGQISYSSTSYTDLFLIESLTGNVVLIGSLDYESTVTQYTLDVVASDNDVLSGSAMSNTTSITVFVTDTNDNSPVCQPFIIYQLPAGMYPFTPFAQLSCIDQDSGNNSLLMYTFELPVQSEGEIFVNRTTGQLSLYGTFVTPGAIVFAIVTSDSGVVSRMFLTSVVIQVEGSDSNAIHFNPDQFNVTISENIAFGTVVLDGVLLQNALVNPAGETITFNLQPNVDNSGAFTIDPLSADIILIDSSNLDFESSTKRFTIVVNAVVNSDVVSTAIILVSLEDFNDNRPIFTQPIYTAEIRENQPANASLLLVTATDRDSGVNGIVQYSTTNPEFRVDPISGEVTSSFSFDRETNERYSIIITAMDLGTPSLNATALVTVVVLDENDNPPTFRSGIYIVDIDNLIPVNQDILILEVTDIDSNSSLRYELQTSNQEIRDLFIVDVLEGVIRRGVGEFPVNHNDSYEFSVQVNDGFFQDTTTVIVYVASITTTTVTFFENNEEQSYDLREFLIIQNFQTSNPSYEITEGDNLNQFYVSLNGLLLLNGELDRERISEYVLTIHVTDTTTQVNVNVYVTVTVGDENDNAPDFVSDIFTFMLPEGVYQSRHNIGFVTAIDNDQVDTSNSKLQYTIVGSLIGTGQQYEVEPETGELYLKSGSSVDRENLQNHTLVIRARDFGEPSSLSNTVTVVIFLTDINDNDPEFIPIDVVQYIVLLGKEDVPNETVLDNIVAILPKGIQNRVNKFEFTDPDTSSNVSARLISRSGNNFYKLEQNFTSNTATLLTNQKISVADIEDVQMLEIVLSDEPNERNPIIRNISIYFTDTVPTSPTSGPFQPSTPFFQTEVGIAVIVVVCMTIIALVFCFLCMCCCCYVRMQREKDPLRNRDRMITVAQRLNTETDRRGRKAHGRPMNYFGFSDLDPLEYPEIPPHDPDLLYSLNTDGELESSFMDDNFENPAWANLVNELEPSTDTSVLSSLPLEEGTNSDSSRGYTMGPILKAMLEEWDKGDELLIKSKKKRRKAKEKEKEPVLQAEEDFFY